MKYPDNVLQLAEEQRELAEIRFKDSCGRKDLAKVIGAAVRMAFLNGWRAAIGDLEDDPDVGHR